MGSPTPRTSDPRSRPSCGAWRGRRRPRAPRPWRSPRGRPDRRSRSRGSLPDGVVAIDARGARAALVLTVGADGPTLAAVPVEPLGSDTDLTRPGAVVGALGGARGGRGTLARRRRPGHLDGPRTGAHQRRPRRGDAGRGRPRRRVRRRSPAVRPAHRCLPGRAAPAGRRLRADGGFPLGRPARGVGGRRAGVGRCGRGRRGWPRPTASRAARNVCETAIQVHGGIGNTWECLAHVYLRRALVSTDVLGGVGAEPRTGARAQRDRRTRWTSVTHRRRRRSGSACGSGWSTTTRGCRRPRPTTTTGRARRPGTSPSTTAGFFGMTWPREIGGHDLPSVYDVIVDEELAAAGAPPRPSLGYLVAGHPRARQRRHPSCGSCPASSNGRERWCQGFSEPDAGSDLASLRTRAERRRRRVRHHRPQGLDQLLRRRRLVPGARPHRPRRPEAQGHLGVRRAHGPARHRAAAAADDQRHHQGVRRGHLRRCPGAGRQHGRRAGRGLARWP